MSEDCVFCRIVRGSIPSRVVWSDDSVVAFLDHRPAARGHTLVVPRRHVENLWDATDVDASAIGRAVHGVAALLRDRLGPDGLTMRQNTGEASGQDVFHLHVHLVPRWHGDGSIGWPSPPPDPSCVDEVAALLGRVDPAG